MKTHRMNTQLQICSFEQACRLKSLGFDWDCNACYHPDSEELTLNPNAAYRFGCIPAPTVALALMWFRDVKNIYCYVIRITDIKSENYGKFQAKYDIPNKYCHVKSQYYDTYEAAESALLYSLLTLIEK